MPSASPAAGAAGRGASHESRWPVRSQQLLRQFQRSLELMCDMFLVFGQGLDPLSTVVLSELAPDGERLFIMALLPVQLRQE